jgi:nucleotide-binding universal stress UspA family protein
VALKGRFRPVVVGVDGSPLATAAARLGVEEARRRVLPVRLVRAFDWPVTPMSRSGVPGRAAALHAATAELDRLHHLLEPDYRGDQISTAVIEGPAVDVLLTEAATAEMLVLGAHGKGPLADVLGPVRAPVLRTSPVPVLSAGAAAPPAGPGGPVVVGVDAGDAVVNRRLLSTALLEATTRSSDLVVVDVRPTDDLGHDDIDDIDDIDDLKSTVHAMRSTTPDVRITVERVAGSTPPSLLTPARDAQLLVVGRGEPTQALSPLARSVLTQSDVPVLVVPPAPGVAGHGPVRALAAGLSRSP